MNHHVATNNLNLEEGHWFENVYQGNKLPELTFKVFLIGTIISVLLVMSNIYLGLKTGMTQGGSLVAVLIAFALVRAFRKSFSILENTNIQTMASAAGSLGIMVSTIPALILLGFNFSWLEIFIWVLTVNLLGVLFVVPLRKQFLQIEKLPFPDGTACAETLKAIHASGTDSFGKAKALGFTALISGAITWFRNGLPKFIPDIPTYLPGKISSYSLSQLNFGIDWSPMLFGVGFLVGPRLGCSLLIGAIMGWGVLAPILADSQIIKSVAYPAVRNWTMWSGVSLMILSGLVTFLLKGKVLIRAIQSMRNISVDDSSSIEIPFNTWLIEILLMSVLVCLVMYSIFGIPLWMTLIAIVLAFIFTIIAVRAYGETNINPVGAMGYSTQIIYGALSPGNLLANVMTAGITASGANQSADMMQDFKTGYLVGATPKRQTYSQLFGVTVGSIVAIPIFFALINTYGIASESLPTPSAVSWSNMAKFLSNGFSALPQYALTGVLLGSLLGIVLALLESKGINKYLPSAFGIGIGLFLPAYVSVTIFLGSIIKYLLEKKWSEWMDSYAISIASGSIVGESVVGVIISILVIMGLLKF